MQNEKDVLDKLKNWANQNDCVRAMVLTSSRAHPDSHTDIFSDYDIELYVEDIQSFMNDDWMSFFSNPIIKWPLKPMSTFSEDWITRLVLFENEVRIDFQITSMKSVELSAYGNRGKVLVDKGGLTADLSEPTFSQYLTKKPTREEYASLVNAFFWDAPYIAKYLWRDELYFAKFMDNSLHFNNLLKMIEWYIAIKHDWSINTGIQGRFFKRFLDSETWAELEATFADANIENNWDALFDLIDLFRKLAIHVGNKLGYTYPHETDRKITEYCKKIKATKHPSAL